MWLLNSSIGKKLIMSISGLFLVLFLLFHLSMNVAAVFSGEAYNMVCSLLGSNWYAVAATLVLAAGVVIHFVYAIILTLQNRKARGNDRYAINARPKGVEWASQNMFVLGLIVILFMLLHFSQFWYKMMFAELIGHHEVALGSAMVSPQDGAAFINYYFQGNAVITVLYLIWYVALWFHLTHGFWSAIQTIGWNNTIWMNRWECISKIVATVIMSEINSKIPQGPLAEKWTNYKNHQKLVNPANKRRLDVIVVGTGLAGASAAASLAEMGFNVLNFCIQDSPRRAHSIAAQGGINAAKNYQNDGDSVYRLFYDTIKGGDYRAREANVYRLAEVSNSIIDQCVAQGVPFAREYGGLLDNRSFGGAQVSRTFYARGQTGQQLLLGAYSALSRQIGLGKVKMYTRHEMLDVVKVDGRARGIIARNLITGKIERYAAHAVVVATGGYVNTFFLSTNAMASNGSAAWQCYKKGAYFANPCMVQIHPTCVPVKGDFQSKLTLMSESLRNDGRIWVPKKLEDAKALQAGTKKGKDIPEADRDYYLERRYPAFGNLVPRDVASRAAKERCDAGFGVNSTGLAVFLDFSDAINRLGKEVVKQKYGNLFDMYEEITNDNPYETPMMIYPALHYSMGGLWVDYELMTSIPGLFAIGEANFSDHGANRLGASALMQGLADGYFVLPYTIQNYLSDQIQVPRFSTDLPEFVEAEKAIKDRIQKLMNVKGKETVDTIHRKLGHIMWEHIGMARDAKGLQEAIQMLKDLKKEFWSNVFIPGNADNLNTELEKALRVADFIEIGTLMAHDALDRAESCGGHFRTEHQTEEGEALRHDDKFMYVSCWEYQGEDKDPVMLKEDLNYEFVVPQTRNYKK